jgi:hypothetical protein
VSAGALAIAPLMLMAAQNPAVARQAIELTANGLLAPEPSGVASLGLSSSACVKRVL